MHAKRTLIQFRGVIYFRVILPSTFDPLLIFDAIIGTKVEQSEFLEQFESGLIFILTLDVRITRN